MANRSNSLVDNSRFRLFCAVAGVIFGLFAIASFFADRIEADKVAKASQRIETNLNEKVLSVADAELIRVCNQKWERTKKREPLIVGQELFIVPSDEFDNLGRSYVDFLESCPDDKRAAPIRLKMLEFEKDSFSLVPVKYAPSIAKGDQACSVLLRWTDAEMAELQEEHSYSHDYLAMVASSNARNAGLRLCINRYGRQIYLNRTNEIIRDAQSAMLKDRYSRGR